MGFELIHLSAYKKFVASFHLKEQELRECKDVMDRMHYILARNTLSGSEKFGLPGLIHFAIGKVEKSKSQIFQDLFVLYCLENKTGGFFVDFGATNGVSLSNTFLLEKDYGWDGILAEPARTWGQKLKENRNVHIEDKCVWSASGEVLNFNETEMAELSTIDTFTDADANSDRRQHKKIYQVETISLKDLLAKYNAPKIIDYLSIDTEGTEFEILNAFDFSEYRFNVITVEHNFTSNREKIFDLLSRNGYKQVFKEISLFDDWYINLSSGNDFKNSIHPLS